MQFLIDTHAFLWFITGSPRCSIRARDLITDPTNRILLSIASLWEIAIKFSLGKLALHVSIDELLTQQLTLNEIGVLPIDLAAINLVAKLPHHHRDPFDRLLVAQSLAHSIPLISGDTLLDNTESSAPGSVILSERE